MKSHKLAGLQQPKNGISLYAMQFMLPTYKHRLTVLAVATKASLWHVHWS